MHRQISILVSVLCQMIEGFYRPIGWIADGSTAKTAIGRLVGVHRSKNGISLSILVDTGKIRQINWRFNRLQTGAILAAWHMIASSGVLELTGEVWHNLPAYENMMKPVVTELLANTNARWELSVDGTIEDHCYDLARVLVYCVPVSLSLDTIGEF